MMNRILKGHISFVAAVATLAIIAIAVSRAYPIEKEPSILPRSLSVLVDDIQAHAPPELRISRGGNVKSFWISTDGFMVAVDNRYSLMSYYEGVIFDDAEARAKLDQLTQYAKQTLIDAGYSVDPRNTFSSNESDPFYAVRAAFVSKDGEYLCVVEPDDTGSPVWFMECIRKSDMTKAYEVQLPFLHAIGDPKGVAAIPTQVGNYARVGITNGMGGYFAIMRKTNDKWSIVYQGQKNPSCFLVKQNEVPVSIYKTCH